MPQDKNLNIRVTEEELARLERLRERLEAVNGPNVKTTQRLVFLTALERLEAHLDKLEKDRERRLAR